MICLSRDLIDDPFRFDLNLADVADGLLVIRAEAQDGERSLGVADLLVDVRRGLYERLRKLEADHVRRPIQCHIDRRRSGALSMM